MPRRNMKLVCQDCNGITDIVIVSHTMAVEIPEINTMIDFPPKGTAVVKAYYRSLCVS